MSRTKPPTGFDATMIFMIGTIRSSEYLRGKKTWSACMGSDLRRDARVQVPSDGGAERCTIGAKLPVARHDVLRVGVLGRMVHVDLIKHLAVRRLDLHH